jgi:fucose 4-O-acetylase-like acetyltransferase
MPRSDGDSCLAGVLFVTVAAAMAANAAPRSAPVRDAAVDIARGLAMLLVIYGHALEIYFAKGNSFDFSSFEQWRVVYSFHMPLFFLISGIVHKRKDFRTVLTGSLMLMAIALMLHVAGWIALYTGFVPEEVSLKTLVKPFLAGDGFHLSIMWFLYSLAMVQILNFLFWRYGTVVRILIVAACVGLYAAGYLTDKNYYQVMSWGIGLLFFMIGHAMARFAWRPSLYLFPFLGAAVIYLAPLNHGCLFSLTAQCGLDRLRGEYAVWLISGKIGFLPLFFVTAVLGSLTVISLAQLIARMPAVPTLFQYIGRHTLDLLIINAFVQGLLNPYMQIHMGETLRQHGTAVALALTAIQVALLPVLLPVTRQVAAAGRWIAASVLALADGLVRRRQDAS